MKTAICISGHLRHYKKLKENFLSFKSAIESFSNIDIFVSAWDRQNTSNCWSHGLSDEGAAKNIIDIDEVKNHYGTEHVKLLNYDFYSSDFSPINYRNLTDQVYNWSPNGIGGWVVNSSKMFLLIYEANKLKKYQEFLSSSKYDLVFRVRPDYEFVSHEEFFKSFLEKEISQNSIYLSRPYPFSIIDDQFAFGCSDVMDKYSSCILKQSAFFNSNIWGDPENILNRTLEDMHKINLVIIPRIGCLGSDISNLKR
jgi:hypothetical protein